jgi:hypothetical protein
MNEPAIVCARCNDIDNDIERNHNFGGWADFQGGGDKRFSQWARGLRQSIQSGLAIRVFRKPHLLIFGRDRARSNRPWSATRLAQV